MSRSQSLLAIHLVAICFGTCGILGELIQADASIITWGRSLFAVISLAVFSRLGGAREVDTRAIFAPWRALLLSGTMLAVHWVTFFVSVKVGGIAVATLGFASFPAFITFVEWALLREPVSRAEWLRLGVVSAGLVLVTPSFSLADRGTEGLLWGLLSGATFGMLAVVNRRSLSGLDAFRVAGAQNAIVLLLLSGWVLPSGRSARTAGSGSWCWASSVPGWHTGFSYRACASCQHAPQALSFRSSLSMRSPLPGHFSGRSPRFAWSQAAH